jgi:hypothetical protein
MATRIEIEEIESTRSEKLFAVVLAMFLLIGATWAYVKADDYARQVIDEPAPANAADRAALDRLERALRASSRAAAETERVSEEMILRREAYRTALDAGEPAIELGRRYRAAVAARERAVAEGRRVRAEVAAARPAAAAASRRQAAAFEDVRRDRKLAAFGARLALAVALIIAGFWLLARLRRRGSRYLPLGAAFVATAAILAFVFAADYVTDYVDPLDLGPLFLSLFGIAATVLAFAALQRHLARRIPVRRVRKGECPFCGYPVQTGGPHCENCGREVVAACATCEGPRRVGTPRCAVCGAA